MTGYRSTHLWKRTLAARPKDKYASHRSRLRAAFEQSRGRASTLAGEIPLDVRDLTVHDVTHFDALWEMADLVVGPDLELTPLEGFVLGEAFLIHDLGMGLAAYPGGLAELRKKSEWRDLLHVSMKKKLGRAPQDEELQNPPQAVIDEVKFWMLRGQHAERAEELALTQWKDHQSGATFYIIEDVDLRVALGKIIGRIAHSHWWPVDSLASRLTPKSIGAPIPFPGEWTVDPLRLALVLRLADASHLDKRRAPAFLKALRDPKGESLPHWTFQSKLHQPQRKNDRLVYTGEPFALGEAAAWWLCCDVLRMVDAELRQVDNLSADLNRDRFAARGVLGAEHPELLANYIPTEGWLPVDASVKATDIATLVQKLGGHELYGDDGTVPLRELIQNATDAVRARRVLEGRSLTWGDVVVRLGKDDGGPWIEVQDNGVGMSQAVVTGPFLDFGTSFWSTPDAVREFPSLLSAGFESTGKYGIGFFSVFMWADRVRVTTRRYDEAQSNTRVLEFQTAMKSRPLLRQAKSGEFLRDGGTIVRIWPREVVDAEKDWIHLPDDDLPFATTATPIQAASWLCPALDANLLIESRSKTGILVEASDWLTMPGDRLLKRTAREFRFKGPPKNAGANVRELRHNGTVVGRACILPGGVGGTVAIGGLRSGSAINIAGILVGESARTSREEASLLVRDDELARWASEQARLVPNLTTSYEERAECARLIGILDGDVGELPIARVGKDWLNVREMAKWVQDKRSVFAITPLDLTRAQAAFGGRLRENVVVEPPTPESLLAHDLWSFRRRDWHSVFERKRKKHGVRPLLRAIAEGWSVPLNKIEVWSSEECEIGESHSMFAEAEEIRHPAYDEDEE
jgi:hypothetical protein